MQKYAQIKDLAIYKDRPELLEAYCIDANATMQKGFALDKMKDDPEVVIDKDIIKSYAKELRILSKQNDTIVSELDADVGRMYKEKDYKSLRKINDAGFILSAKIMSDVEAFEREKQLESDIKILTEGKTETVEKALAAKALTHKEVLPPSKKSILSAPQEIPIVTPVVKKVPMATKQIETVSSKELPVIQETETLPVVVPPKKKLTKLEYYQTNIASLKEELYRLREDGEEEKMACLNDITAMNYWMIKVLQSSKSACSKAEAIRQMKSYDKAAAHSCGRQSLRYIQWHGSIKPYVGRELFEAEASCHR